MTARPRYAGLYHTLRGPHHVPGPRPAARWAHPVGRGAPPGRHGTAGPQPQGLKGPESISGAAQDVFWRGHFRDCDYTESDRNYEYYRPAFRAGWEARAEHPQTTFAALEQTLRSRWNPDLAGLSWQEARPAVRDAFERADGAS